MTRKLSEMLEQIPMKRDIGHRDIEWLRSVAKTAENAAPVVNGKVPAKYIPEYFNDIVDFPSKDAFPAAGEAGKFYVDSSDGAVYRWNPQAGGGAGGYVPSPDPLTADVAELKTRGYVKDSSGTVVAVVGSGSGGEVELQAKLTIDSEPTSGSDNPVSSGGVKTAIDNVKVQKVQKVYNASGTDALDDKGQLFKSSIPGASKFVSAKNGTTTEWPFYRYQSEGGTFNGHAVYSYGTWYTNLICYDPTDGVIGRIYEYGKAYVWDVQVPKGLDPRALGIVLFSGTLSGMQFGANDFRDVTWAGRVPTVEPDPYARFAIESMPTAWAASTTYMVGVCASYDGKAYRCTTEHTSGSTFDASKWVEIPVLKLDDSMPAEPSDAQLAEAVKKLWVHLGGTLSS